LGRQIVEMGDGRSSSGLCPVVGFSIGNVKPSDSAARKLEHNWGSKEIHKKTG